MLDNNSGNKRTTNDSKKKYAMTHLLILIVILLVIVAGVSVWLLTNKNSIETNEKVLVNKENNLTKSTNDLSAEDIKKLEALGKIELVLVEEKNLKVGDEVNIKVLIDTQDFNVVLSQIEVNFATDKLELLEINEQESVFEMAIRKEIENGKIELIRGSVGDGDYRDDDDAYTGSGGALAVLKFKILVSGQTQLVLNKENSNLILDDGQGSRMNLQTKDLTLNIE